MERARPARVVCTGIATIDEIFTMPSLPAQEGKYSASAHVEIGGGVAANAAVAVARLGGSAAFIGCVGSDDVGDRVLADLSAAGVDVSRCQVLDGCSTPISAVLVDDAGHRVVVNHAAPELFHAADASRATDIGSADAVLVDCRWPAGACATLDAARTAGAPGVVDVDRPLPGDAADRIFGLATHLVFSREGLRGTTGLDDTAGALTAVARETGAWSAVTDGAEGVTWWEHGALHHLPALRVDVVDTTGAGDVFHGAFALALAEGCSERDATRFASIAAALKCGRGAGRVGIPDRDSVDARMARTGATT